MINFKILNKFIILNFIWTLFCSLNLEASYEPQEGRITYALGGYLASNSQDSFFNSNDTHLNFGSCQSFGATLQVLGDLDSKSSLVLESSLGHHKFCAFKNGIKEEFKLESVQFDFGYRRFMFSNFWAMVGLGSMYPWRISQKKSSQSVTYDNSDFNSVYSFILSFQYEVSNQNLYYDLRFKKSMNGELNDQSSLGLLVGYRFQ